MLRDHGLAAGLKWLGAYMHKHDMAVTVTVPKAHLQLPEDQALLLFQSVRELLMNAWKHAATGKAEVTMELDGDRLRIHVHDDGRGFDLAAAETATSTKFASKFGLFSIRERMNALGGSFEIESAPHQGTTATLTLPLGPHRVRQKRSLRRLRLRRKGRERTVRGRCHQEKKRGPSGCYWSMIMPWFAKG